MKLQAEKYEVESLGADDAVEFGMETTDPAVIQIMLENIYPDPYVWPRELMANWYDAGGGGSLTLPDALEPMWVIEDHGPGMTHEFMTTRYSKIFSSTKRDSNTEIGGFGHGRLSPLAYTDTYNIRSRFEHEGEVWEGNYVVFRGDNKIPKVLTTSLERSEVQQTGVTVSIPVGTRDISRITERTTFFGQYLPTPPEGIQSVKYIYKTDIGGHRERDQSEMQGVRLILGGVPYPAPRELRFSNTPIDLFFELGELQPTLARDAINASADVLNLIRERIEAFKEAYRAKVTEDVEKETSLISKYVLQKSIMENMEYNLRQFLGLNFSKTLWSKEDIFKVMTGDFRVHDIISDITTSNYSAMSEDQATLRSLNKLSVRRLISHGLIGRENNVDLTPSSTGIELKDFFRYHNQSTSQTLTKDTQLSTIALFAIKGNYTTGQVKLLREAIAAKAGQLRKEGKLSSYAKMILIQYENESDVKAFRDTLHPNMEITIITDSSNRIEKNPHIQVMVFDQRNTWAKTKAIRSSKLSDMTDHLFYVRQPGEKVEVTRLTISSVYGLSSTIAETGNIKVVAILAKDSKYLPKKAKILQSVVTGLIKKNLKYKYDISELNKLIELIRKRGSDLRNSKGLLGAKFITTNSGYSRDGDPILIDKLLTEESLASNVELQLVKKDFVDSLGVDLTELETIRRFYTQIERTISNGLITESHLNGGSSLPTLNTFDSKNIEAFYKKYPLLPIIADNYHVHNYGVGPTIYAAIVDYLNKK